MPFSSGSSLILFTFQNCVTEPTDIRVWINEGELAIGADIMYLLVAGRLRTDVLPVFQELLSTIKNEIVREEEM